MTTDALESHSERRLRMLHDPDLAGDLLLFALGVDVMVETHAEHGRKARKLRKLIQEVAELVHPDTPGRQEFWGKQVIADDFPRYEAEGFHKRVTCVAPMIRREGLCGKNTVTAFIDSDPKTGEGRMVGLCGRHRWHTVHFDQRHREWLANGKPVPPANAGGVLRRYFEADWDRIYSWARPGQEVMEGGREATPPRPKLRLIQGGDESEVTV